MKVTVTRPFPYAGFKSGEEPLPLGSLADLPEDLVPGLKREGYVREPSAEELAAAQPKPPASAPASNKPAGADDGKETPGAVEIPEKWRELEWPALQALAAKLGADPIKSKNQAVAAVEAELARRASAQQ